MTANNTAKTTIALLTGASMLAFTAGPVMAADATATTSTSTQVETGSKTTNEAEKTDISGEEAVAATKDGLNAAGKAVSDAATAAETNIRELLSNDKIEEIEGTAVRDSKGDSVGEVGGVVRSNSSKDLYFVVDVGGFLGLGEREVALPASDFQTQKDHFVLASMTKEQLETHDVYNAALYSPVTVEADGSVSAVSD